MYIHADMRGVGTLLLALDGIPVGLVIEADTAEGWVRRYDTRNLDYSVLHGDLLPSELASLPLRTASVASLDPTAVAEGHAEYRKRVAACPIVRVEGKVDFIGDTATDPDWMIAQRLTAVRIRHGLPIDTTVAHATSSAVASVLERLASQLRSGSMVASNLGMSWAAERFPLPDDKTKYVRTGAAHLSVNYASVDGAKAYEDKKAAWAKENPDLVAQHVRSLAEGESKVIQETETLAANHILSAQNRKAIHG